MDDDIAKAFHGLSLRLSAIHSEMATRDEFEATWKRIDKLSERVEAQGQRIDNIHNTVHAIHKQLASKI